MVNLPLFSALSPINKTRNWRSAPQGFYPPYNESRGVTPTLSASAPLNSVVNSFQQRDNIYLNNLGTEPYVVYYFSCQRKLNPNDVAQRQATAQLIHSADIAPRPAQELHHTSRGTTNVLGRHFRALHKPATTPSNLSG